MVNLLDRLNWMKPSTKRLAFMLGVYSHGTDRWFVQEVWREVRPAWKSCFWTGAYPLVDKLEAAGVLESGWEELPPDDPRAAHPRRWYQVVSPSEREKP